MGLGYPLAEGMCIDGGEPVLLTLPPCPDNPTANEAPELPHGGLATVDWIVTFTHAARSVVRIRTLLRVGIAAPSPMRCTP